MVEREIYYTSLPPVYFSSLLFSLQNGQPVYNTHLYLPCIIHLYCFPSIMDSDDEFMEASSFFDFISTIDPTLLRAPRIPVPRMLTYRGSEIVAECFGSDRRCMETTRMDNKCLWELVEVFRHRYQVNTRGCSISLEEQIVMTLNYLSHASAMSTVSTMFGHCKDTMSRVLSKMLVPLLQLYADEIKPADQSQVHPKFKTTPIRKEFKGCIGALDGTHVPMHPPESEQIPWRGRPRIPTTNILAICDHNMLFNYFFAGAEGSMHDTRVLDMARDQPSFHFPHPLPGKYYLCDSGYVNKPGYMTPFRFKRYHPHEFNHQDPVDFEEFFNQVHSGLRCVIERTFGVWKNKWHIIHKGYSLLGFELQKQVAIIEATAALHNFVRRRMGDIYLEPNEDPVDAEADYDVDIDLNRSPPPEAIRDQDWTMDREKIAKEIFRYR